MVHQSETVITVFVFLLLVPLKQQGEKKKKRKQNKNGDREKEISRKIKKVNYILAKNGQIIRPFDNTSLVPLD